MQLSSFPDYLFHRLTAAATPTSHPPPALQATRMFVSNLNQKMSQRFLVLVLLPHVRADIRKNRRLHFALFQVRRPREGHAPRTDAEAQHACAGHSHNSLHGPWNLQWLAEGCSKARPSFRPRRLPAPFALARQPAPLPCSLCRRQSLKKATYKAGAFYKGLLLPLCASGTCNLREAVIFTSVIRRTSIPVLHSAAAMLRIAGESCWPAWLVARRRSCTDRRPPGSAHTACCAQPTNRGTPPASRTKSTGSCCRPHNRPHCQHAGRLPSAQPP